MSKFYGTTTVKDLKVNPSAPSANDDGNNSNSNSNNNNYDDVKKLNLQPPEFQKFLRGEVDKGEHPYNNINSNNDNNDEGEEQQQQEGKICRICLEEEGEDGDDNDTMIAPCRCKGGSKWVHRECLDEWRTNERDRAFSKCTECLFEYYIQPVYSGEEEEDQQAHRHRHRRRQCYFYWKVSRDVCFGIVIQQLIIILLGIIIWTCDVNKQLPTLSLPLLSLVNHPWILYYLFGWFAFLIILGIYGLIIMCLNDCNLKRAIPKVGPPSEADDTATPLATTSTSSAHQQYYDYDNNNNNDNYFSQQTYNNRSAAPSASTEYYRRARHRRRRHYYRNNHYYDNTHYPMYYPMYVYPTGNHGCCCCCCDSNGPPVDVNNIGRHVNNNHGCCDCDCDIGGCFKGCMNNNSSNSSSSNDSDAKHIILIILLVIAIILAMIGFIVGVIIVVIAFQRIVGRHIYLLQKRQLVQEFQVLDLQEYDLDKPIVTATATSPPAQYNNNVETGGWGGRTPTSTPTAASHTAYNNMKHPAPSAPYMPPGDAAYLKRLGLVDGP
jgi:hypothetical protein